MQTIQGKRTYFTALTRISETISTKVLQKREKPYIEVYNPFPVRCNIHKQTYTKQGCFHPFFHRVFTVSRAGTAKSVAGTSPLPGLSDKIPPG